MSNRSLKSKIRRYTTMARELPRLEREIKREAHSQLAAQGYKAAPRFERIIEQFG